MQSAATHLPLSYSGRPSFPAFKVVIVYEDFKTGSRAQQACDFMAQNLRHSWQVIRQMWKFELLGSRELRQMAAEDAVMADVIIVSCRADRELPPDVRDWIEMWSPQEGGAVALVAVLDRVPAEADGPQCTRAYLEGAAKRARMEFFVWPPVWLKQRSFRAIKRSEPSGEALLEAA